LLVAFKLLATKIIMKQAVQEQICTRLKQIHASATNMFYYTIYMFMGIAKTDALRSHTKTS